MSREIKRKINNIKEKREKQLKERVARILDRHGYQFMSDEDLQENNRAFQYMWSNMTPLERIDYFDYFWPQVTETLMSLKDLLIYPIFKSLVIDKLLLVVVKYHKSFDDWEILWKLQTLWMWASDPEIYREWHETAFNPEFESMPKPYVDWYKNKLDEWNQLVEEARTKRIDSLKRDLESLQRELADPKWQNEPDYLEDLKHDINDIERIFKEIKIVG